MKSNYKCKKCGFETINNNSYLNHLYNRKNSCNKEFDLKILNLAFEKIKTFENSKKDFEITYTENDYTLYIKRNCFHNTPYFEDFVVRYDEIELHSGFFAEWCNDNHGHARKDKLKFSLK